MINRNFKIFSFLDFTCFFFIRSVIQLNKFERESNKMRANPFFFSPKTKDLTIGSIYSKLLGVFFAVLGFTLCLTILYLGMRGVLKLGGFVASGGPYEIAHPAPSWIWTMPVSIFAGFFFVILYWRCSRRVGGVNSILMAWSALFISLGYNFFEFGFNPPGMDQGVAWAWIICGVLFWLMGAPPLIFMVITFFKMIAGKGTKKDIPASQVNLVDEPGSVPVRIPVSVLFILHIIPIILGIYGAIIYFKSIS